MHGGDEFSLKKKFLEKAFFIVKMTQGPAIIRPASSDFWSGLQVLTPTEHPSAALNMQYSNIVYPL